MVRYARGVSLNRSLLAIPLKESLQQSLINHIRSGSVILISALSQDGLRHPPTGNS